MAGAVYFEMDGLREAQQALRKAGASLEEMTATNRRAAEIVEAEGRRQVPVRSGTLRKAIVATATKSSGKVIAAGLVPYGGVIHFGWSTRNALGVRGQSRKVAQARFEGVLSKRAVNKALAGSKTRVNRRTGVSRGAVRGGPIRPNPFLYRAVDLRHREVFEAYDDQVAAITKVAGA